MAKGKTSLGQAYWDGTVVVLTFVGAVFLYRLVSLAFDRIFYPLPKEQTQPRRLP